MTKAQVLTVENPLGMHDGCYAKQRNGEVTGPWNWDGERKPFAVWHCGADHRFHNGKWRLDSDDWADLIAVVSAPLPEPIERFVNMLANGTLSCVLWDQSELKSGRVKEELAKNKLYRVRIEFLEEVTL